MIVIDNPSDLEPTIALIVANVLAALSANEKKLGDKLAFSEPEAASLLGLEQHQLRDVRRRGEIASTKIVGRRIRYPHHKPTRHPCYTSAWTAYNALKR